MMIDSIRLLCRVGKTVFLLSLMLVVSVWTAEAKTLHSQLTQFSVIASVDMSLPDVHRFYSAREYQPVWVESNQPLSRLDDALAFIETADAEGLNSADYRLQRLRQLRSQIDHTANALFELELGTTQALLMLARDLKSGYLPASIADPDWHIPQQLFDPVPFLLEALAADSLSSALVSLSPASPSYQLLKKALARYRKWVTNQTAWTQLPDVSLIRPNGIHAVIPLIRNRIAEAYKLYDIAAYNIKQDQSKHYDDALVNAIKVFQAQHGLNADGVIGKKTVRALNMTPEGKIRQLRLNLERLRWLPAHLGERYLLVNIAGFRLTAVERGEPALDMRIIVGHDYRSTPSFSSRVTHLIINPFWNIPASIARQDLLPKQQRDPGFFEKQGIKVYQNYDYNSEPLDPDSIDWQAIRKGFPYILRQDPGVKNALGTIKFMLPNPFSIYLHDTPSKSLFQRDVRTFSSGCIRLEKPMALAGIALNKTGVVPDLVAKMREGKTTTVNLSKPLPIYIVYMTAWVDEKSSVHYSPDIYGRDARALNFARW
ncbi:Murein L,D-transpeptidase YcbB/YkuD [Nitrosomonas cryotolerans]|uniref:Murein L,D-transpeptidase YcbB/YkuD n=2 Tax=Nitrosomonas cryotolerans TaxID=44575 RepID=A0A1N6JHV5_9PROT|nr:Murein L,D-transpeptidase YcbB/YkuD [Nitrosomonas cryotolerans]SIO43968.1 Murein L,D-transpeptidase YcbB/YkuD [Nitrosomonas cryotolerans ATCC 49181]